MTTGGIERFADVVGIQFVRRLYDAGSTDRHPPRPPPAESAVLPAKARRRRLCTCLVNAVGNTSRTVASVTEF